MIYEAQKKARSRKVVNVEVPPLSGRAQATAARNEQRRPSFPRQSAPSPTSSSSAIEKSLSTLSASPITLAPLTNHQTLTDQETIVAPYPFFSFAKPSSFTPANLSSNNDVVNNANNENDLLSRRPSTSQSPQQQLGRRRRSVSVTAEKRLTMLNDAALQRLREDFGMFLPSLPRESLVSLTNQLKQRKKGLSKTSSSQHQENSGMPFIMTRQPTREERRLAEEVEGMLREAAAVLERDSSSSHVLFSVYDHLLHFMGDRSAKALSAMYKVIFQLHQGGARNKHKQHQQNNNNDNSDPEDGPEQDDEDDDENGIFPPLSMCKKSESEHDGGHRVLAVVSLVSTSVALAEKYALAIDQITNLTTRVNRLSETRRRHKIIRATVGGDDVSPQPTSDNNNNKNNENNNAAFEDIPPMPKTQLEWSSFVERLRRAEEQEAISARERAGMLQSTHHFRTLYIDTERKLRESEQSRHLIASRLADMREENVQLKNDLMDTESKLNMAREREGVTRTSSTAFGRRHSMAVRTNPECVSVVTSDDAKHVLEIDDDAEVAVTVTHDNVRDQTLSETLGLALEREDSLKGKINQLQTELVQQRQHYENTTRVFEAQLQSNSESELIDCCESIADRALSVANAGMLERELHDHRVALEAELEKISTLAEEGEEKSSGNVLKITSSARLLSYRTRRRVIELQLFVVERLLEIIKLRRQNADVHVQLAQLKQRARKALTKARLASLDDDDDSCDYDDDNLSVFGSMCGDDIDNNGGSSELGRTTRGALRNNGGVEQNTVERQLAEIEEERLTRLSPVSPSFWGQLK
eukprot:PhM_4_TR17555/c0_g1_i1/m.70553